MRLGLSALNCWSLGPWSSRIEGDGWYGTV